MQSLRVKKKRWSKTTISGPVSNSQRWSPNRICTLMSLIAILGLVIGIIMRNGIPVIFLLLPAAIYQVIRTAGFSTKAASIVLLASIIIELVLVILNIQFDLSQFMGQEIIMVGSSKVPLGDARLVLPFIMVIAAIILLFRTRGAYTKWLSAIIIVNVFGTLYIMFPEEFPELIKLVFKRIASSIGYMLA